MIHKGFLLIFEIFLIYQSMDTSVSLGKFKLKHLVLHICTNQYLYIFYFSQYTQVYLWELSFELKKCVQKKIKGHLCIEHQMISII